MKSQNILRRFFMFALLAMFIMPVFASTPLLKWNTFFGETWENYGEAVATDSSGNVIIAGHSYSNWGNPIRLYTRYEDGFVAKYNSSGVLLWSTFLGSNMYDRCYAVLTDASGNIYVEGESGNTWGSPIEVYPGGTAVFFAKLDPNGNLLWNTFIGSGGYDRAVYSFALDASSGIIYAAGTSQGTWGVPIHPHSRSYQDAYVVALDTNGRLLWHTFFGYSSQATAIALDHAGHLLVLGYDTTTWGTPVAPFPGGYSVFLAQFNTSGQPLWNTFFGSSSDNDAYDLAIDANDNIYVGGYSDASWGSPLKAFGGAGHSDGFIAKFDHTGQRLWNTFLGLDTNNLINGVALDNSGNLYVVTESGRIMIASAQAAATSPVPEERHGRHFRTTAMTQMPVNAANADPVNYFFMLRSRAYVAKYAADGSQSWLTLLDDKSAGYDLALGPSGNIFVTGVSTWTWGTPVHPYTSDDNGFVAALTQNYTVNFSAGANGTLTGQTSQVVEQGGNCTPITATPDTAYYLVNWTGNAGFTTQTANPLTVANVTADMTINANFATVAITLQAQRLVEQGWLIKRAYATLNFTVAVPDSATVTQYVISRRTGSGAYQTLRSVPVASVQNNSFSCTDAYLDSDKTYTYQVKAQDAAGNLIGVSSPVTI